MRRATSSSRSSTWTASTSRARRRPPTPARPTCRSTASTGARTAASRTARRRPRARARGRHAARHGPQPQLRHVLGRPGGEHEPVDQTYRGAGPFSEPETQNIRDLVASRQVTNLITNHTYSNLVLRPPGVREAGFPIDEPVMEELGAKMTAHNGYANDPSFDLYDTTGGAEDWTTGRRAASATRSRSARARSTRPTRRAWWPSTSDGPRGRRRRRRQPRGVLRDARGDRRRGQALGHRGLGPAALAARDLQGVRLGDLAGLAGRRRASRSPTRSASRIAWSPPTTPRAARSSGT